MVHFFPHPPIFHLPKRFPSFDILRPLRRWVNHIEVYDRRLAHLICRLIPCACPFEQEIAFFHWSIHIPPLCKLNPLYTETVNLRLRALSYLADVCNEDVSAYLC